MTPVLHIEPRPFTSPCVLCAAVIPLTQTVSLADEARDTVCDDCGERIDPTAHAALAVLRAADDGWWRLAGPGAPVPGERLNEATAYLRHMASGLAVIAEWYGASAEVAS